MDSNKISTHAGGAACAAALQARCRQPEPCPPTRAVKACTGSEADPNAAARRGMDFWAFLERENRRHPGTVQRPAAPEAAGRARAADEGRVVSYGMPRLGAVPGSGDGAGPIAARAVPMVRREFFTPVGTRVDLLA